MDTQILHDLKRIAIELKAICSAIDTIKQQVLDLSKAHTILYNDIESKNKQ